MDWFLYDSGLRHERINVVTLTCCLLAEWESKKMWSKFANVTPLDIVQVWLLLRFTWKVCHA